MVKIKVGVDIDKSKGLDKPNEPNKLTNIKELINVYDKVGEKAKEYIKDIIRIELSSEEDIYMDIDEFIKMIPWLHGARVSILIKKEEVNNMWCKRFIDLLSIYMPHCTIVLEDDGYSDDSDTLGIGS
ncbi:MAG: hypothetical protein QXK74_08360 [Candidatus Nitrosocaldaceae archaeon]